jgi:hypothetical protein
MIGQQDGNLSALDLLTVNNLVNYFGQQRSMDDVTINPILIEKGKIESGYFSLIWGQSFG